SLDPRNPWGDAYFESGAPKPGSIAELDQAIKRRLREEANSREPSNITSLKAMVFGPCVKAMPTQAVNPSRFRINVDGQWVNFVADSGVESLIVVPERLATLILAKKWKTFDGLYKSIVPPMDNVQIHSCTGGEGPIVGQAVVTLKNGDVEYQTEMLLMKTDDFCVD
ncbi:MAG: hypothetical protein GY821_11095, partial [Gammaproteobacteria bacterium]|nr:hypothetical protein [Gammaproteobacteria bacterium]